MDDEGNILDLIRSVFIPSDGLIYSDNGNTFGGICPDVRGDTPDATNNTAYGYQTLNSIEVGSCNTMYGYQAGNSIANGFDNIAIGCKALYDSDN